MLTFRSLAAGALSEASAYTAHLLEQTLPEEQQELGAYYGRTTECGSAPTVRADLDPRLAEAFAVRPGEILTEERLAAILSGRRADKRDLPAKKQKRKTSDGKIKISGMDLCLSAPKSVSVAWAFAKPGEQASILQAHRDAVTETLRYIEEQVGGRVGQEGRKVASRMAWVSIEHFTARATIDITRPDPVTGVVGTELYTLAPNMPGDMQLHTHNIVPNLTVTDDDRLVALNTMQFHGRKKEFGAVYQAFLAAGLRRIGIEVALCPQELMARLPVIPEHVCKEFSKRTDDAEESAREAAAKEGADWDELSVASKVAMLKRGAKATRRAKADDLANFAAWRKQADDLGWKHETAITGAEERHDLDAARETALPLLAEMFKRKAVIFGPEARLQAVRGLIQWGIRTTKDIGEITRRMVRDGVVHDGRLTRLRWAETNAGVKITTDLHIDQEQELVDLARKAATRRTKALRRERLNEAVARSGLKLDDPHGQAQRNSIDRLGLEGDLAVLIGVAGSGKSALLKPLVDAWKREGYQVFGLALAWRQAGDLRGAGIERIRTRAIQNFITGVTEGWTTVDRNAVVVIDELGQVGTLQLLRLLQLQAQYGFKIVAVGDDRQCQSILAGPVIDLLRQALGAETVPEILTTIRQQTERERDIAGKFRDGEIEAAITMKRADDTAELVPGGYDEAIARVADLYMEHRCTISAPTNAEAHAIGQAIRERRREAGEITGQDAVIDARDNLGNVRKLELATGDRVRLFRRTHGLFNNGRDAHVGDNGTVLEIKQVLEHGIRVKAESGKVAFIKWERLQDADGIVRLAYGDCLTIDSAQGITSDEHILAMPGGSRGVQGFKAYVGMSRHRKRSWIVGSEGMEMREVDDRRPLGVRDKITHDDLWGNVVRNLSRRDVKETALDFQREAEALRQRTVRGWQSDRRRSSARRLREALASRPQAHAPGGHHPSHSAPPGTQPSR